MRQQRLTGKCFFTACAVFSFFILKAWREIRRGRGRLMLNPLLFSSWNHYNNAAPLIKLVDNKTALLYDRSSGIKVTKCHMRLVTPVYSVRMLQQLQQLRRTQRKCGIMWQGYLQMHSYEWWVQTFLANPHYVLCTEQLLLQVLPWLQL
jgi:hypothetical protein